MCLTNSLARSFRQRDHQKLVTRVFSKYTRLLTLSSRCGGLVTTAPTTLPLFTTSFGRPSMATRALNYVIYLHIVDTFLVYFQLKIRLEGLQGWSAQRVPGKKKTVYGLAPYGSEQSSIYILYTYIQAFTRQQNYIHQKTGTPQIFLPPFSPLRHGILY